MSMSGDMENGDGETRSFSELRDFLSRDKSAEDGAQAFAGAMLPEGHTLAEREALIDALRTVHDPEIPVNIYDLGLIYGLEQDPRGNVDITMTLTAPACPVAGELPQQVADAVAGVPGAGEVVVTLTWTPPWNPTRMSEDARMALDLF